MSYSGGVSSTAFVDRQLKTRRASTHPCVFSTAFMREQIDPRIKAIWPNAPFGNLRKIWREQACMETNPYSSEWCPYSKEDCAIAYLKAVESTVYAMPRKSMTGYFRSVCHTVGMERAERKPLARESQEGPSDSGDAAGGIETRWGMRRADSRPTAVGDVLGTLADRARQRSATHGGQSKE